MRARVTLAIVAVLLLAGARARAVEGDWPQAVVNVLVAVVAVVIVVRAQGAAE